MICVYYTSTDTGREDISNTDNKVFLHIDSMGFLRLVRMIRGRTVKKRTAAINTAIRFLLAGRVRQMSESAFVSNLSYESRPFGEAGIIGDPYGRRAPRLRAGRGAALTCHWQVIHSRALRVPRRTRDNKTSAPPDGGADILGDPYGTRTHVTAVKGRCLNHLTNGPYEKGAGG